ncbi:unnamed protein product [Protopolystoma xenopodis]|uniref:Uncharacterized protein n=1 Tax=Protopolystoma xenopodis TaxID=117903 RepID=A0A3S5CIH9_9PLAT|nr:unnamed protein product [Protopolystoma xenopodis]
MNLQAGLLGLSAVRTLAEEEILLLKLLPPHEDVRLVQIVRSVTVEDLIAGANGLCAPEDDPASLEERTQDRAKWEKNRSLNKRPRKRLEKPCT